MNSSITSFNFDENINNEKYNYQNALGVNSSSVVKALNDENIIMPEVDCYINHSPNNYSPNSFLDNNLNQLIKMKEMEVLDKSITRNSNEIPEIDIKSNDIFNTYNVKELQLNEMKKI